MAQPRIYGIYVSTSLESPFSIVVVPRRSRLPGFDLLISRWRLLPQLRLTLPVAVTPKRFFAPLLVFILGIFRPCSRLRRQGMPLDAKKRGLPSVEGAGYSDGPPRMQGRAVAASIRPPIAYGSTRRSRR